MSAALVSIIIVTYNNPEYLIPCVNSILLHQSTPGLYKIIIVNNGDKGSIPPLENPLVQLIEPGKNLGWEGGLKKGLEVCDTPFVVFMNDDTYIPYSSAGWLLQLLQPFANPSIGAVGPSSNCVMGPQNAFVPSIDLYRFEVKFLIGFCMMLRREALEKAGGVDDTLPYHGDDLDLSIRLRQAGYRLICDKSVFVYHHGFKTGGREFGSAWNSVEMTEKTNTYLIKKHGLKVFWDTMSSPIIPPKPRHENVGADSEGETVRKFVKGAVLELGCGPQKTVPEAIGVDIIPKGQEIPGLIKSFSIADIVADVSKPLPIEPESYDTVIARHILEHIISTRQTISQWAKPLKVGGRMIIAVPNEELRNSIPLNFQHVRAFTPSVLKEEMESMGFKTIDLLDPKNDVSFVGVFEKLPFFRGHDGAHVQPVLEQPNSLGDCHA